jgi:hypothetical protein
MTTKKRPCLDLIVIVLLLAISSGCYAQRDSGQITETSAPSQTSTPIKTDVPKETEALFIQLTNTPTLIATTETPSSMVTMSDSDREKLVQNFLEINANCRLPCIWKIIPGESSWVDLENRLRIQEVESIISISLENGDFLHGPGGFNLQNKHIINSFSFVEHDGVVTKIHLESDGYANPEYFQGQWRDYSPKQIMSLYGKPSRVWLKTRSKTMGNRHGYELWLVYDDYGFIIQYNGFLEEMGKVFRICPRFENGMDIMWLQIHIRAPGELAPLEEMGGLVSPEPQAGKKSIEDATGLSVDDFYELFHQNQEPACFDTPSDIWE